MISAALPVTLKLGLTAIFLLSVVGIILGVIAALNQNKLLDNLIVGFALIVWGIPVFVAGPLIIVFLVLVMDMDVPYGWSGLLSFKVIVPLLVLGLNPMALIIRQARAGVLEVLSEDYVRTARAKGIPHYQVVVKHIMRPVLDTGGQPDRPADHRHPQQFHSHRKGLRAARSWPSHRNRDQILRLSGHSGRSC